MRKVIVVFANSVKHGKHCVAGKDVQTRQWIRPVSDVGGSELDHHQCVCVNPYGTFAVKPLQKVEIGIASHCPLVNQPENYLVGGDEWNQRYKVEPAEVAEYLDAPDSLWGIGNRVTFSSIESGILQIEQSLYLVKVDDLKIYKNPDNKRRASFFYNGNGYDLPVTDPNFENHLNNPQHQGVLCVSLGEKHDPSGGENYSCYKIVATII
ncbi:MAG: dual OB domain-containing protein [Gammaproteobacteria bacterium]